MLKILQLKDKLKRFVRFLKQKVSNTFQFEGIFFNDICMISSIFSHCYCILCVFVFVVFVLLPFDVLLYHDLLLLHNDLMAMLLFF